MKKRYTEPVIGRVYRVLMCGKENRPIGVPRSLGLFMFLVLMALAVPACKKSQQNNSSNNKGSTEKKESIPENPTAKKNEPDKGKLTEEKATPKKNLPPIESLESGPFRFIQENALVVARFSPESILAIEGLKDQPIGTSIDKYKNDIRSVTLQILPAFGPIRLAPCWHIECKDASTTRTLATRLCPGQPFFPPDGKIYPSSEHQFLAVAYPSRTSFLLGDPRSLGEIMFFPAADDPPILKQLDQIDASNHLQCVVDADRLRNFVIGRNWSKTVRNALNGMDTITASWNLSESDGLKVKIAPKTDSSDRDLAAQMVDFLKQQIKDFSHHSSQMLSGSDEQINEFDQAMAEIVSKLETKKLAAEFTVTGNDLPNAISLFNSFANLLQLNSLNVAEEVKSVEARINFRRVSEAMHAYHSKNNKFPRDILSPDNKPLLSWRVELCSFIDPRLFSQFDLEQPWDSPANKKLIAKMPKFFRTRGVAQENAKDGLTTVMQVVGKGTPLGDGKSFKDIVDGSSYTFMLVESAKPVPWTQPADFDVDRDDMRKDLRNYRFIIAWFDSSVAEIRTEPEPVDDMHKAFGYDDGIWGNPNRIDLFDEEEWTTDSNYRQPPPSPDTEVQATLERYVSIRDQALDGNEDIEELTDVLNELRKHPRQLAHPMTQKVWNELLTNLDRCSPAFQVLVLEALRPWRAGAQVDFALIAPFLDSTYDRIKYQAINHSVYSNGKERAEKLFKLTSAYTVEVNQAFQEKYLEYGADVAEKSLEDPSPATRFKACLWIVSYGNSSQVEEMKSRIEELDGENANVVKKLLDGRTSDEGQFRRLPETATLDEIISAIQQVANKAEVNGKSVRVLKLAGYDAEFNDQRQVTDRDLIFLPKLSGLEKLDLDSELLTSDGLSILNRLESLKELSLNDCHRLDGRILSMIGDLENLERLELSYSLNSISNLGFLNKLRQLKKLKIAEARLGSSPFEKLQDFENLQDVELIECNLFDSQLKSVGNLEKLTSLSLRGNPITDNSIGELSKAKSLKSLDLRKTFLTDEGIKKLKLALPQCSIDD